MDVLFRELRSQSFAINNGPSIIKKIVNMISKSTPLFCLPSLNKRPTLCLSSTRSTIHLLHGVASPRNTFLGIISWSENGFVVDRRCVKNRNYYYLYIYIGEFVLAGNIYFFLTRTQYVAVYFYCHDQSLRCTSLGDPLRWDSIDLFCIEFSETNNYYTNC
jgi:hypothetical protein